MPKFNKRKHITLAQNEPQQTQVQGSPQFNQQNQNPQNTPGYIHNKFNQIMSVFGNNMPILETNIPAVVESISMYHAALSRYEKEIRNTQSVLQNQRYKGFDDLIPENMISAVSSLADIVMGMKDQTTEVVSSMNRASAAFATALNTSQSASQSASTQSQNIAIQNTTSAKSKNKFIVHIGQNVGQNISEMQIRFLNQFSEDLRSTWSNVKNHYDRYLQYYNSIRPIIENMASQIGSAAGFDQNDPKMQLLSSLSSFYRWADEFYRINTAPVPELRGLGTFDAIRSDNFISSINTIMRNRAKSDEESDDELDGDPDEEGEQLSQQQSSNENYNYYISRYSQFYTTILPLVRQAILQNARKQAYRDMEKIWRNVGNQINQESSKIQKDTELDQKSVMALYGPVKENVIKAVITDDSADAAIRRNADLVRFILLYDMFRIFARTVLANRKISADAKDNIVLQMGNSIKNNLETIQNSYSTINAKNNSTKRKTSSNLAKETNMKNSFNSKQHKLNKKAQYVGVQGYFIANSRALQKRIRELRAKTDMSPYEAWITAITEYNDYMTLAQTPSFAKYASANDHKKYGNLFLRAISESSKKITAAADMQGVMAQLESIRANLMETIDVISGLSGQIGEMDQLSQNMANIGQAKAAL